VSRLRGVGYHVFTPDARKPPSTVMHSPEMNDAPSEASRMLAMSKWTSQRDLFVRVKDDGRAEAALIADFGINFAGWGQE